MLHSNYSQVPDSAGRKLETKEMGRDSSFSFKIRMNDERLRQRTRRDGKLRLKQTDGS
jgi:hypothetical protein